MSVGLTNLTNIANYLGVTLTSAQQTWATTLMDPAEQLVFLYTRQTWEPTPLVITNEQYDLLRDWVSLRSRPVQSVQSVLVRTREINDPGVTLTQGTDYELQDPQNGLLVLTSGYGDPRMLMGEEIQAGYPEQQEPIQVLGAPYDISRTYALISYTASQPVPADITQATTLLIAHWMRTNLHPERFEVDQIRSGEQMVKYELRPEALPPEIVALLDLRKRPGVFG